MKATHVYRILFTSEGKGYEIYARRVNQSEMYGFVEIEGLLFGERSSVVVDPTEEALRSEFAGVKRLFIPFHSVSRIDEVEKEGKGRVLALAGQGERTPSPAFPPARGPAKK